MNLHNVRMAQRRNQTRLALKKAHKLLIIASICPEQLDRYYPIKRWVEGFPDFTHSPTGKALSQNVFAQIFRLRTHNRSLQLLWNLRCDSKRRQLLNII